MVQLKYYGDDRDYFKYDLISYVLRECEFDSYGFVPMLTEHRYDNEGNIAPSPSNCKSKELLSFIRSHSRPDLNNWESWLNNYTSSYITVQPVNSTYIRSANRKEYWLKFNHVFSAPNSLIFFDPDTGIQAGRKTRIKPSDYEKYILNEEMPEILGRLSENSAFVIYQHLQRNSKLHESDMVRKIEALSSMSPSINISAYREKDLAFMFIAKGYSPHQNIQLAINKYHSRSTVEPRGVH